MRDTDRFLAPYRTFQKIATGLGLFIALVGAGMWAAGIIQQGQGITLLGATILLHGMIALGFLRHRDHKERLTS